VTRLLVVTAQPPLVEGGAAGRCMVALLRGLRACGVDVETLAPRQEFAAPGDPPDDLDVEIVAVPGTTAGRWDRLRHPVADLARGAFADRVREAAGRSDAVYLDQIETACLSREVADRPTALHLHYRARRDAPLGAPWRPAFRHRLEFARAERRAIGDSRWLVANSAEVLAGLRPGRPGGGTAVVPLAIDPADYPLAAGPVAPVAGIIGTASWAPTRQAMLRLCREVWPLVRALLPDARLHVAGRGTDRLAAELAGPGVTVTGPVESAAGFLRSVSVLVFPPGRGSGTKVKVLEALASAVPVVCTPPGAEGLAPNPGLVVATSSGELASAVARLLTDGDERARRGTAGRAYIEARHGPAAAAAPLVALLERMVRQ